MPIKAGWRPGQRVVERPSVREQTESSSDRSRIWTLLAVAVILLISLARVPHLNFPLERDEGEFGYIAQQLLHGVPVYESGYTQKLPGVYLMYALFLTLFGQTARGIHFGLLLVNAAIMGLIFLTLRRTHGGLAGVTGALAFGFMALSPSVLGFACHATFFVALLSMAGLYLFLLARDRASAVLYLGSGLCFGLAFLMKQPAIFFAPLLLGFMIVHGLARSRRPRGFALGALAFLVGSLAPFLLTAAYYAAIGRFGLLWYWSFRFAGEFVGQVKLADGLKAFVDNTAVVMSGFEVLWAMALVGFCALIRDAAARKGRYPYLAFGVASMLSIVPGLYFARHYYVSLLPFLGLAIGGLMASRVRVLTVVVALFLVSGMLLAFWRYERYFTKRVPDDVVARFLYPDNPFPESVEIGRYLKSHTAPGDSIAILGSETQIFFYAQRPSASRYINVYYPMADHPRNREMQHEMIRDIERVRPSYLIFVHIPWSWSMRETSPRDLLSWYEGYRENYRVEGVVQMERRGSVITWGPDASGIVPAESYIEILHRLDDGSTARGAGG